MYVISVIDYDIMYRSSDNTMLMVVRDERVYRFVAKKKK